MKAKPLFRRIAVLAAAVLLSSFPAAVEAGPAKDRPLPTRLAFTAFEGEKEAPVPGTNLAVFLSGGYGLPDMEELDRYVDYINDHFSGTVSHVHHYSQVGFGVEWRGPAGFFAGMGFQWIDSGVKGSTVFSGKTSAFRIDIDAGGLELYGGKRWPRLAGPVGLEALAGAGWYRSRYREKENGYDVSGNCWAPGFRGGLGIVVECTEHLTVHAGASFRFLRFDDYENGTGTVRFVSPGHPDAEADFSGFLFEGRAAWRF